MIRLWAGPRQEGGEERKEKCKRVIMSSYTVGTWGQILLGPQRDCGTHLNVPLRATEPGCLSSAFGIALEGLTPGSLRLHMSPQLGNVLMEDLGRHRGLLGTCLL